MHRETKKNHKLYKRPFVQELLAQWELYISQWHLWRKFIENSTKKETSNKYTQNIAQKDLKHCCVGVFFMDLLRLCLLHSAGKKKARQIQIDSCSNPQILIPQSQCCFSLSSCLLQPPYWERCPEGNTLKNQKSFTSFSSTQGLFLLSSFLTPEPLLC